MINGITQGGWSWAGFTGIANGTRVLNNGWDQCVALANLYHQGVNNGGFVAVGSAYQWWDNFNNFATLTQNYRKSSTPVAGAIFVSRYGLYDAPNGHIGVVTSVNSNGTFNTMEQNAGTWRYVGRYTRGMQNILGFLIPINNKANPAVLKITQRQVGKNPATRRTGAGRNYKSKDPSLKPGEIGNFQAYAYGERVNDGIADTNLWYQGVSTDWFWAGAFKDYKNLKGLKDKTSEFKPGWRTVGKNPATRRTGAGRNYKSKEPSLPPNTSYEFAGYAYGEQVNDGIASTNIWYVGKSGDCFWAGAFKDFKNLKGLKNMTDKFKPPVVKPPTEVKPPVVKPPVVTPPPAEKEWKYVAPSIVPFNPTVIPDWITVDYALDNEIEGVTAEEWNTDLAIYYDSKYGFNRNYEPVEGQMHWWDSPDKKPTHDGVVNYLRNTEGVTVNFVVSPGRVTIMMPLTYNATTTGKRNLWGWKMEIDPALTPEVYATAAWVIYEVEKQNAYLRNEPLALHKDSEPTSCSDIDRVKLRAETEAWFKKDAEVKPPVEPPVSTAFEKVKVPLQVVEHKDGSFDLFVEVLQPVKTS